MSGPSGNSLVFPRGLMFPATKSRETSKLEGKQNCFSRDKTLGVLLRPWQTYSTFASKFVRLCCTMLNDCAVVYSTSLQQILKKACHIVYDNHHYNACARSIQFVEQSVEWYGKLVRHTENDWNVEEMFWTRSKSIQEVLTLLNIVENPWQTHRISTKSNECWSKCWRRLPGPLYSDRDKRKRKRVNSNLDSFGRLFGGNSPAETPIRNTKSDATSDHF